MSRSLPRRRRRRALKPLQLARGGPVEFGHGRAAGLGELELFAGALLVAAAERIHADEEGGGALAVGAAWRRRRISAATSSSPADILPSRNLAIGAGHSLEVLVADLLGQQAARIAPGADLRRVAPQERPQPRPERRAAGQAWRRNRRPPGRTGRDRNGRGRDSRAPCAGRPARSSRPAPRRAGRARAGSRRAACRPGPGRSPARNRPASAAGRCRACAAPPRGRRRRPAPAACSTARAARSAGRTLPISAMSFWLSASRPSAVELVGADAEIDRPVEIRELGARQDLVQRLEGANSWHRTAGRARPAGGRTRAPRGPRLRRHCAAPRPRPRRSRAVQKPQESEPFSAACGAIWHNGRAPASADCLCLVHAPILPPARTRSDRQEYRSWPPPIPTASRPARH